ncbi:protein SUPPRESSOR OF PHYA-105 1 [Dorcoceras hygrometricum]|uniref:Protein SUPPRESSOR OF PHYA-105 1 n=1 Tax=Dorcoceras hygrometricum TaxID=472368 RepID=A0A2Z7BN43_9LAMI|nr:protein SUPPRESSOR OF PHYA-105 1 [Dorcoceras hygrometricum]
MKKLIAQRRKADKYVQQLVQYKQSAVGLVFIESAVALEMETSRVNSVVRSGGGHEPAETMNQLQALKRKDEPAGTSCTRRPDEIGADGFSSSRLAGTISGEERRRRRRTTAVAAAAFGESEVNQLTQESAGSLHPDARGSDVVVELIQSQATVHQQIVFGDKR